MAQDRAAGDAGGRWERWLRAGALLLALLVLAGMIGLRPLRSLDYWWHLRTGQLIAETGSVPRADPYTFTVPGARWIDLHWAFQLGLHGLHRLGGHEAVRLAKAACVLALLAVLGSIGARRERLPVTALALGTVLVGASGRLMERPELPSFLLLASVLALLERHRRRRDRWVFAIVPVQLLWANVHGSLAVGIAICGMALVAEWLGPRLRRDEPRRPGAVRDLAWVTALSLLVAPLNPNGLAALRMTVEQLGMIGPGDQRSAFGDWIIELAPTLSEPYGAVRLAVAGGLALAAMLLNRRRVRSFDLLLFVAFFALALAAQRNVALLAIVSAPIAVHNLNDWLDRLRLPSWWDRASAAGVFGLLVVAIAVLAGDGRVWHASPVVMYRFPEAAADWIARERPPGPIYHSMWDGGYLIWRLYPEYRVMADGRLEVFGAERFAPLHASVSGRPEGFRRLDVEYGFGIVLLNHGVYRDLVLLRWLGRSPEWRLVELDEVAAVFVRVGEDPPPWPELGAGGSELLRPFEESGIREVDLGRRGTRIALLHALGRPGRARAEQRETCARYPDLPPHLCGQARR